MTKQHPPLSDHQSAASEREQEEVAHKAALSSAWRRIAFEIDRSIPMRPDQTISIRFTWGELRALRQFGRKFYDE